MQVVQAAAVVAGVAPLRWVQSTDTVWVLGLVALMEVEVVCLVLSRLLFLLNGDSRVDLV